MDMRRVATDLTAHISSTYSLYHQARLRVSSSSRFYRQYLQSPRSFTTSQAIRQQGAAPARKDDQEDGGSQEPDQREAAEEVAEQYLNPQGNPEPAGNSTSNGAPTSQSSQRTSQYNSPGAIPGVKEHLSFLRQDQGDQSQQQKPQPGQEGESQPATSKPWLMPRSVEELLNNLGPSSMKFASSSSNRQSKPPPSGNAADASLMMRPARYADETEVANLRLRPVLPDLSPPTFRRGPSLGRTVEVNPKRNTDVARAFAMVNMRCATNSVRSDLTRQRFHERPGTRRKRLVSERWRKRFMENFRTTVRRVEELKRKGW